ncbi:hypothetical protein LWF15_06450 [Kineosporia rhizophila]|uniref:hypothetical protein n=1 Tax=Kineosporia TaxID=49184 RepID=UPI001E321A05|nr:MULTISPECIES: hypothetical protein [Kineosporia]MCE0535141.1 hypothetical protein [Kineosporia rhizophila]GLY14572.1 hypothetical protein Kisp01_15870 [Kineosporia sp. NBRC 101677]
MAKKLFPVVLRGYDTSQIDELFARVDEVLANGDADARAAIRQELSTTVFTIALRGYPPTDVAMAVEQRLSALS